MACGATAMAAEYADNIKTKLSELAEKVTKSRDGENHGVLITDLLYSAQFHMQVGDLSTANRLVEEALALEQGIEDEWRNFFGSRAYRRYGLAALSPSWSGASHMSGMPSLKRLIDCYDLHGQVRFLQGDIKSAVSDMSLVDYLAKSMGPFAYRELLLHTGFDVLKPQYLSDTIDPIEGALAEEYLAMHRWVLGTSDFHAGKFEESRPQLIQAERYFQKGEKFFELARARVTLGNSAISLQDVPLALKYASEALDLAVPKGMKFVHANALVLRGRVQLHIGHEDAVSRGIEDAETAIQLAQESGNLWAQQDALQFKAVALAALAKTSTDKSQEFSDVALRARNEADDLSTKLCCTSDNLLAARSNAAKVAQATIILHQEISS
jgi:tetratricopeptide (TPR) repeat protein